MLNKKRSEKISKIVNRVVIVAFVLFVFIAFFWIYLQDVERAKISEECLDKSPILAQKEFNYGNSGFQAITQNEKFTLYTDFTTGEICVKENETGYKWYSNPQDREGDTLIALKSNLSSQFYVNCIDLDFNILKEENNYAGSIEKGCMTYELIENGIKYTFAFPTTGVVIPVQYTINEDGLLVEILVDEIEEQWSSRYVVDNVSLLPWFGAGGLSEEGYLFIPDGSGALMEFNNNKNRFRDYSAPVYGRNLTTEEDKVTINEQILMPVFGINKNQYGFLGVIISGESHSTINASVSKRGSSYNYVYPVAVIRDHKFVSRGSQNWAKRATGADYTADKVLDENYAVQYMFLEQGQASYSDMAACYREYLQENGQLKQTDLADKDYVILDLYGAVSIEKFVMGVKTSVVTSLTTYEDVIEIVKELKAEGVENLIINYIGAMDSGLNGKMLSKVKTESVLGSIGDFKKMANYLAENGVLLFLETNPIDMYNNGNGYNVNDDSAKGFFQGNAFQYKYELDSGKADMTTRWRLMRPGLVPGFVESFAKSAAKKDIGNVSLAKIGEALYTDYNQNQGYSREETMILWEETLSAAASTSDNVMVHKGNVYCAPYADVITDLSISSSCYDMADYSVPFYHLVMRGSSVLSTSAINASVDYNYFFLKAQELGCSLKYNLIAGDIKELVGTEYNDMVSYSYDNWKDTIVEEYHRMQEAADLVAGETMIRHEFLAEDVTLTEYESGAVVLVNYSQEAYTYDGQVVEAESYVVVGGGTQ